MSGITELALLAILCVVVVQWVARRLRLPLPGRFAISLVFVLVVLALWGQTLRHR
ncbi:MAG TPA: hypothetical protein VNW94_26600 [Streptosporangiaceae bacterium]|jgi:hypothetical protein|nr:hypothetical protein [Streptosporangiaceae bacterium]